MHRWKYGPPTHTCENVRHIYKGGTRHKQWPVLDNEGFKSHRHGLKVFRVQCWMKYFLYKFENPGRQMMEDTSCGRHFEYECIRNT